MTTTRKIPTAEEITSQWGERCPDYEPDCACCQMWAMHDAVTGHAEMHRRAQKAEGAVAAARFVLDGWGKLLSDGRLPQHDFLMKTIRREFDAALSRAERLTLE